jgi:hypothetical protein
LNAVVAIVASPGTSAVTVSDEVNLIGIVLVSTYLSNDQLPYVPVVAVGSENVMSGVGLPST